MEGYRIGYSLKGVPLMAAHCGRYRGTDWRGWGCAVGGVPRGNVGYCGGTVGVLDGY
jgi:hypothetical protein